MTRRLTLRFEAFGWESLEAEATHGGQTLAELLGDACAYFDSELRSHRAVITAPRLKIRGEATPREVELALGRGPWERLEDEARRQGIELERLLEHVALVYLADLHSGRVASRVLRRAEGNDWEASPKPKEGGAS